LPVAAFAVTHAAFAAEAQPTSLPVVLEVEACEAIDERTLVDLLSVEFRTLGVTAGARPERIKVECHGTRALVILRSTVEAPELAIKLDMAATMPAARSRLLALAISELVVEGRSRETEPPAVRTEDAAPIRTEAHAVALPERGLASPAIVAAASVRYAARPATWLMGAAIAGELPISTLLGIGLDARAESGSTGTELATVGWTSLCASAAILGGASLHRFAWGMGPGFRAGYLRLAATPTVPDTRGASVGGLWAGPMLTARARYDIAGRAFIHAGLELGWTIASVTGNASNGRQLMDVSGSWALLTAGMGLPF
jgi:hypothetical protein